MNSSPLCGICSRPLDNGAPSKQAPALMRPMRYEIRVRCFSVDENGYESHISGDKRTLFARLTCRACAEETIRHLLERVYAG